jgi:integrase
MRLHGLERRIIRPMLGTQWHGFHGFRRGLATNLYRLGVPDLTIQKVLRHSNVATTQTHYIKSAPEEAVAAMKKVENSLLDRNWTGKPATANIQ